MTVEHWIMYALALTGHVAAGVLVLVFLWASLQAGQGCLLSRLGAGLVLMGCLTEGTRVLSGAIPPTWSMVLILFGGSALLGGSLWRNGALRLHLPKLLTWRGWFVAETAQTQ